MKNEKPNQLINECEKKKWQYNKIEWDLIKFVNRKDRIEQKERKRRIRRRLFVLSFFDNQNVRK